MVYVSTACLKGLNSRFEKDFYKVMDTYIRNGITDIELGSAHNYFSDIEKLFALKKKHDLRFTMHCFFPPLKEQLWVNIASQDNIILKKSMNVAFDAIELCRKIDAPLYSMHGGYTVDFRQGDKLVAATKPVAYAAAFARFLQSIQVIADKARENNIKIAVETLCNTMGYMLMSRPEEFIRMFDAVKNKNLGVLFDFGHVYTNEKLVGISADSMIKALGSRIFAFHIHDSKGDDSHDMVEDISLFDGFPKSIFKKTFNILEANFLSIGEIMQQKALLEGLEES